MRVGFAGTPEFAARALAAIVRAGYTIPLTLTQPDRPKGRRLSVEPSAVKRLAQAHGLTVMQPATLKDPAAITGVTSIALDVLVVAAYGLLLPAAILAWPQHGCINIHASRLPRWRGAAPIVRAIEAGDTVTGITLMQMDAGLDTGSIIASHDVPIAAEDTAASLGDKLADEGARAIVGALEVLARTGALPNTPQSDEGVTYASKITRADAAVDWRSAAPVIERKIRAFDPAPGAFARWQGVSVKLWRATTIERTIAAEPGAILRVGEAGIDIACGTSPAEGALRILEIQAAGGKRMPGRAFALGHRLAAGMRFDAGRV